MKNNLYDKDFRAKLKVNPKGYMNNALSEIEYKVVESSKDITYIAIPYIDNNFDMESLSDLSVAGTASSGGTIACASTLGSVASLIGCVSTLSSAGTATTIGSAGTVKV